jgi:hypothetical protein
MKKFLSMFLWLAVTIALTGCIKEFTPKESIIQLKAGESQTFKAVSDDRTAKLVWYLDGRKVAYDKNTYTYKAEANNGQKPIVHKLIVKEEGGRYVQYYKVAGLPRDFMSSVTWTIKVLPSGCMDGETRETTCGIGACAATGVETCSNGAFGGNTCESGTPSAEVVGDGIDNDCDGETDETTCVPTEEVCDGVDNDCDNLVDEEIDATPTTCGIGACSSEGELACVNGDMSDSCQPGTPSEEVTGDGIDNDCDGETDETSCVPTAEVCDGIDNDCDNLVDEEIAATPTSCGIGACARTGEMACLNGGMSDNCQPGTPSAEVAGDGIDNDCDGEVDEVAPCVPTAEVCDGLDNDCDGVVDDGIASTPTTCGVGACASTGALSCQGGQMVDSCQTGPPTAEACDGIDNNCDGAIDNGIASQETACGLGACASTGMMVCANGGMSDSCQPGTPIEEIVGDGVDNDCDGQVDETTCVPVAEVCDGIDNDCDQIVDEDIASIPTTCGVGACASTGTSSCVEGQFVDNCQPGTPAAVETCDNSIDDNCDGLTDGQDTVACAAGPPAVPSNVQATDCDPVNYDPAHVNITVTWEPVAGAEYYRVHRAIFAEDNTYEVVAGNVTGTSFEYVQTWQEDVLDIIGPTPGLSPTADFDRIDPDDLGPPYNERQNFIDALNLYREEAVPTLFNFKAPAFFRVQACNSVECSDLSAADAGSAEYIHTAEFSEVAQHTIPSWGYAQLVALADAPPGANGLSWCGIDLCGSGGGIAMGRVLLGGTRVNIDVGYDAFTETLATAPGSYFAASGRLSGRMPLGTASDGQFLLSGSFTLDLTGRSQIGLSMYARIGAYATDGETRYNDGVAAITYKGLSYQFTLPIQPIDGISGHPAAAPTPVIPAVTIPPSGWVASTSPFPTPLVPEEVDPECMRVWTGYVLEECPVSIAP